MDRIEQGLVTAYKANSRDLAFIAKGLLDAAGIPYSIVGDGFRSLEGYSIFGDMNIGIRPYLIRVLEEDESRACEALRPLLETTEPIDEETLAKLAEEAGKETND
ncbi:MAG TPA: DUF2007 domain-containing protein [Candidatus Aquicultor sp.]